MGIPFSSFFLCALYTKVKGNKRQEQEQDVTTVSELNWAVKINLYLTVELAHVVAQILKTYGNVSIYIVLLKWLSGLLFGNVGDSLSEFVFDVSRRKKNQIKKI